MLGAAGTGCKKLTEISPFLVNYPLRDRLPALVVIPRIVVIAVFAGMQGPVAGGAGGAEFDSLASIYLFTAIPTVHFRCALFPPEVT